MQGGADVVVRESEKRMQRLGKEHKKKTLSVEREKRQSPVICSGIPSAFSLTYPQTMKRHGDRSGISRLEAHQVTGTLGCPNP
jgi:hypothetical protein